MSWATVLPLITYWDASVTTAPSWVSPAAGPTTGLTAAEQARITGALEQLYTTSSLARDVIDRIATQIGAIRIAGGASSQGLHTGGFNFVVLNLNEIDNLHYFNDVGALVQEKFALSVIHELIHVAPTAYLGDPLDVNGDLVRNDLDLNSANYDAEGDTVRLQNQIAEQMGWTSNKQADYFSTLLAPDPRIGSFGVGVSWSDGQPVDQVRIGTNGADVQDHTLHSSPARDLAFGLDGDDTIKMGAGDDIIFGGGGNDVLEGADGADMLNGDAGADTLIGGLGADTLKGGEGNDSLNGGAGGGVLIGDAGNDTLTGGAADDILVAGEGNNTLDGGGGANWFYVDKLAAGAVTAITNIGASDHIAWNGYLLSGGLRTLIDGEIVVQEFPSYTQFQIEDIAYLGALGEIYRYNSSTAALTISLPDGATLQVSGFSTGEAGIKLASRTPAGHERDWFWSNIVNNGQNFDYPNLTGRAAALATPGAYEAPTLIGGDGADSLAGAIGEDKIWGGGGNDVLLGDAGADVLYGGGGADTLTGGADADHLAGGAGSDTYIAAGGDGADQILDDGGSADTDVLMLSNVASTDVVLSYSGNDLIVTDGTASIVITVVTFKLGNGVGLEEIRFSDGVTWNRNDIAQNAPLLGTPGNDSLTGSTLDDVLIGGAGNDTLAGAAGDDTYRFNSGDGNDVINEIPQFADADRLIFGAGLNSTDVVITRSGPTASDVTLGFAGNGSVFLDEQFFTASPGYGVEQIEFGDGVVWSRADLRNAYLVRAQTTGADTVTGFAGADTLQGLTGNDRFTDVGGSDTYIFNAGDGADTIIENLGTVDTDRLVLGAGLTTAGVVLTRSTVDTDDITLSFGAGGSIYLDEQFSSTGPGYGVEQIEFGDGAVWTKTDLQNAYLTRVQTLGADTVTGFAGADTLQGLTGNDRFTDVGGSDVYLFDAGDGADTIIESFGSLDTDRVVLGAGLTTANVVLTRSSVDTDDITLSFGASGSIYLDEQFSSTGPGYGVEQIEFGDGVVWSRADLRNAYLARAQTTGADTVTSFVGADTLQGLTGNDRFTDVGGSDTYIFNAGDGADTIIESFGSLDTDRVVLGAGLTTANLVLTRSSVDTDDITLSFGAGGSIYLDEQFSSTGPGYGVEQIEFGDGVVWSRADLRNAYLAQAQTTGADTVTGFAGADVLQGLAGNDSLSGLDGADTLVGGAGADTLNGGTGADVFRFEALSDAPAGTPDVISSFVQGSDKIDLTSIDADLGVLGDQAFSWIGTGAFTGVAGQLRYTTTPSGARTIFGDVNGDAVADIQIQVTGANTFVASDFVL